MASIRYQQAGPASSLAFFFDLLQGPTVLLCEPGELKQLWQEVPDDLPPGAWDAAYTKVLKQAA
jgi:hypothetical protein